MSPTAEALRERLIRNLEHAPMEHEQREPLYETLCARLATGSAAKKLGASFDILAPGKRGCPYHFHHAQEELFVVLEGSGTLRVAGEMLPISKGDVIFIPSGPAYPHQIINSSQAPLHFLSISTRESPEIVEYPDSGKFLAYGEGFDQIQRSADSLDYWDGEP